MLWSVFVCGLFCKFNDYVVWVLGRLRGAIWLLIHVLQSCFLCYL